MKVEIQIDENCGEPRLIVVTRQVTDEIQTLIQSFIQYARRISCGVSGRMNSSCFSPGNHPHLCPGKKTIAEAERPVYRPAESAGSPGPVKPRDFVRFPIRNHQSEQGEPF